MAFGEVLMGQKNLSDCLVKRTKNLVIGLHQSRLTDCSKRLLFFDSQIPAAVCKLDSGLSGRYRA